MFIQTFIPHTSIESFHKSILTGLAWLDELKRHA